LCSHGIIQKHLQKIILEGKYVEQKKINIQHRHEKLTKSGGIVEFEALPNEFFFV
jgi:hypothetical protein